MDVNCSSMLKRNIFVPPLYHATKNDVFYYCFVAVPNVISLIFYESKGLIFMAQFEVRQKAVIVYQSHATSTTTFLSQGSGEIVHVALLTI
jgi:hypothetical protein